MQERKENRNLILDTFKMHLVSSREQDQILTHVEASRFCWNVASIALLQCLENARTKILHTLLKLLFLLYFLIKRIKFKCN